jgi:hypothetical protein
MTGEPRGQKGMDGRHCGSAALQQRLALEGSKLPPSIVKSKLA